MTPVPNINTIPVYDVFPQECIPDEIFLEILTFLTPKDLFTAERVCHYWRDLTHDSSLKTVLLLRNIAKLTKIAPLDTRFSYQRSDPCDGTQLILTDEHQMGFYCRNGRDFFLYEGRDAARTQPITLTRSYLLYLDWEQPQLYILNEGSDREKKIQLFDLKSQKTIASAPFNETIYRLIPSKENRVLIVSDHATIIEVDLITKKRKILADNVITHREILKVLRIKDVLGIEMDTGYLFYNMAKQTSVYINGNATLYSTSSMFLAHCPAQNSISTHIVGDEEIETGWHKEQLPTGYDSLCSSESWVVLSKSNAKGPRISLYIINLETWVHDEHTLSYIETSNAAKENTTQHFAFLQGDLLFYGAVNVLNIFYLPTKILLPRIVLKPELGITDVMILQEEILILVYNFAEKDYRILRMALPKQ